MEPVPSLREVFEGLAGASGDPDSALEAAGHGALPEGLMAEAIVNYAAAAPVEVAEHLSPFVIAHSPVPQGEEAGVEAPDTATGLQLLTSVPTDQHTDPDGQDGPADLDGDLDADLSPEPGAEPVADDHRGPDDGPAEGSGADEDLSFGTGERSSDESGQREYAPHVPQPGDQAEPLGRDGGLGTDEGWLDVTEPDLDGPSADTDAGWTTQEDHGDLSLDHDDPGALDGGAGN